MSARSSGGSGEVREEGVREKEVDLVWLGAEPPAWPLGEVVAVHASNSERGGRGGGAVFGAEFDPEFDAEFDPESLVRAVDRLSSRRQPDAPADDGEERYLLFWDPAAAGVPDPRTVERVVERPGDVWHAGLALGQVGVGSSRVGAGSFGLAGLPRLLDHTHPTWMLHLDPPVGIEASSWRLSLRACLLPTRLWQQLAAAGGTLDPGFRSLEGASLDLGFRLLRAGVLCRHVPALLPAFSSSPSPPSAGVSLRFSPPSPGRLPEADGLRFLRRHVGRGWTLWACGRATWRAGLRAPWRARDLWRAWAESDPGPPSPRAPLVLAPLATRRKADLLGHTASPDRSAADSRPRVTVLVPTLDRYPYLEVLLRQLATQTQPAHEVIVVDQTEPTRRRRDWAEAAPGLPLVVLERQVAGQCTSRNAGLRAATGDVILFLDDDDEIEPDLLERHLRCLAETGADVSCGVADEAGIEEPKGASSEPGWRRLADVFPTNNAMVRRSALERSGLFDLAFERGSRADMDLGLRLYTTGALMVLDPAISVFHHRAPRGGLREHGAREITYAASRQRLGVRHLPSATELYLHRRHFPAERAAEADVLRLAGTLAIRGSWPRRLAKILLGLALLPDSYRQLYKARRRARSWLAGPPRVPRLGSMGHASRNAEEGSS